MSSFRSDVLKSLALGLLVGAGLFGGFAAASYTAGGEILSFTSPLSKSGGSVTLGTVPVSKGGTGVTSFSSGYLKSNGSSLSSVSAVDAATEISGVLPTANGGAGWNSWTCDLTAQATQTLGSDTTYTVCGVTVTKFNSTNDQSAAVVTNGTGLVFTPKSTSDYNGATRTFPGIAIPFSQISSSIDLTTPLRIWVYISAGNYTANYDASVFGVDSQSNVDGYMMKRGYNVSSTGVTSFMQVASANKGFVDVSLTLGTGNNVLAMFIPYLGDSAYTTHYGTWSSGLPAFNSMTAATNYFEGSALLTGRPTSTWSVILGGQRAASGTAFSTTFAYLRVDYKP